MPAVLRYPSQAAFIRVGQDCHQWGDPYRVALDCEIVGDIAIIGGLDLTPTGAEYRDLMLAITAAGLRPAMYRANTGFEKLRFLPVPRKIIPPI